jgi:hypothetical protein
LLGISKSEYLRISCKAIRHFVLPLAIYLYKKVGIKRKNFSKCRKVKKVNDPNFVMECKTLDEILVKFRHKNQQHLTEIFNCFTIHVQKFGQIIKLSFRHLEMFLKCLIPMSLYTNFAKNFYIDLIFLGHFSINLSNTSIIVQIFAYNI